MDLQQALRRDWLMLNSAAVRNALVASAAAAQRSAERADVELAVERSLHALREQARELPTAL